MASRGFKDTIQVEWINVSYRSLVSAGLVILLAALGIGAYWFYFQRYVPRETARRAIGRAEARLAEARAVPGEGHVEEIVHSAQGSLEEARGEFGETRFQGALVAAIRSENLSIKALSLAAGEEKSRLVRFYRIEGDVRVKQAETFSWQSADSRMVLRIGDQVKTSSSGSAQLIYFDGTVTSVEPGSLLEIRDLYEDPVTKVRRVREKLSWGEVQASTQERNVSGSYHEVATEKVAARSEKAGEFRVAHERGGQRSVVDVFDGRIEVSTASRKEALGGGERIAADAAGGLGTKQALPGAPRLLTPSDQRVFLLEDPTREALSLGWEPVAGGARYRLTIADRSLFSEPLYDAERQGTTAEIDAVPPGSYFWRVAAISKAGVQGPFSPARRFRVSSQRIRDRSDTEPPRLQVSEFVPIGQMVVINGETEPGATLWVDDMKVDVYDDGSFNAVVRLRREGVNEVLLVAQDTAGNETTLKRTAFVELF
jgi:hypothetical protein